MFERGFSGAFCLDVRTLAFCQLMGFPLNPPKVELLAGEQKATKVSKDKNRLAFGCPSDRSEDLLVKARVDPSRGDLVGETPLMEAASHARERAGGREMGGSFWGNGVGEEPGDFPKETSNVSIFLVVPKHPVPSF